MGGKKNVHQFYSDPNRNREYPPWFFENTSRELAESILTLGKRYGNVLVRESVTFKDTGSYVISMRREVAGGTTLNHYEVKKSGGAFKINVDNAHRPMRSLNEVMHFFINQAGPGTQPMSTNDPRKLGIVGLRSGPTTPNRRQVTDDDSGVDDDDHNSTGARSTGSPPPLPPSNRPGMMTNQRRPGGKLHVQGNVPLEMHNTAHDIEYSVNKRVPQFDQSRMSIPPAPPPPPPGSDFTSRARRTSVPEDYGQQDNYGSNYGSSSSGPPPPPPPPMMGVPSPPPHPGPPQPPVPPSFGASPPPPPPPSFGSPPPPPPPSFGSPPPPAPPSFGSPPPPAPPSFGASPPSPPPALPSGNDLASQLANATLRPAAESNPTGFNTNTTPNRGIRGAPLSFEDELKNKLVHQRENVYASGAQILKSNYGDGE